MEKLTAVDQQGRRVRLCPNSVPRVDVRLVLFTVRESGLLIALQERDGRPALPRWTPILGESLDAVATHILDDQIGSSERYLEQLYSISHGSEGNGTVSVTYLSLARAEAAETSPGPATWFNVNAPGEFSSVDQMIVDYALLRLRAKLGYTAIAFHLLPRSFTLSELQAVYEVVLDREVDKRNFRRRIHAAGLLEATGESRREGSHRPARLYRLQVAHDTETYLTPAWATQPVRKVATR